MIELWWATVAAVRADHRLLLDDVERERLQALRFRSDRDRFLTGAALARLVVGHRVGVAPGSLLVDRPCGDCARPHGRPHLRDGRGPVWSVAHSGDHVVVAVTNAVPGGGPAGLGVDVERIDPDRPPPEALVWSPVERRTCPDLWSTWVRKEAALKATGEGLRRPMSSLTAGRPWPGSAHRRVVPDGRPDLTADVVDLDVAPGYVAAVAVVGAARTVRPVDLDLRHRNGAVLLAVPTTPEEFACER